jgi:hypothetical protein
VLNSNKPRMLQTLLTWPWNHLACQKGRTQAKVLIIKPTRCTNFSILFWNETLHVSDSSSVHHQELFTVKSEIGICQNQDGTAVLSWSRPKVVYKPVWHIPLLCVQWKNSWWWTEELSETCNVSFQNKTEKLVHLVGFIIRIRHDARSHERQKTG